MSIITIHNAETNEIIEREMDAKELAQFKKQQAQAQVEDEIEIAAKAKAELNKAALLDKLGITAEEAKLLLS